MKKFGIIDRTSSFALMGLTCAIVSANTSVMTQQFDNTALYSTVDNKYGTGSDILKSYPIVEKKLNVEKEAQSLFGNMREATIAEQKSIQNNIDKISVETGYNFWD